MLTTRTFKPSTGAKIHVLHETKTTACYGFLMSLCGKQFPRRVEPSTAKATCPLCVGLDNPFNLSTGQTVKFWNATANTAFRGTIDDLLKRDLLNPQTRMATPRGVVLATDLKLHPPWADQDGVVHARNAIAWGRAICGADLVGVYEMTYAKLDRLLALRDQSRVTCIECMLET